MAGMLGMYVLLSIIIEFLSLNFLLIPLPFFVAYPIKLLYYSNLNTIVTYTIKSCTRLQSLNFVLSLSQSYTCNSCR